MRYEYIPHKNIKQASGLLVIFISAAVGCFAFPSVFPSVALRWLFQMAGALLLVATVFVYTRKIAKTFIYRIVEDDGEKLYFTVTEITNGGRRPINDFIVPYVPSSRMAQGSTDVGDVSWLTPTAQFTTATWISGSPGHSWQNVATGTHAIAHKGMLLAAKVLAATAADLMEQPDLLNKARAEFQEATYQGYDCPIGKEVTIDM